MSFSSVIRLFSTLIIFIVLARILGPKDFGEISYNFALASLIILIVDYGFNIHLLKIIAKDIANTYKYVNLALYSKVLLTLLSLVLISILDNISIEFFKNKVLFFELYISLVFFSFAEVFNIAYRAHGHFEKETENISFSAIVHSIAVLIILVLTKDLLWIGLSFALSRLLYLIRISIKFLKFLNQESFALAKLKDVVQFTKEGAIYAADGFVTNFFYQIDSIFVKHLLGVVVLGQYQAAMKFLQGIIQFASVLANVFIPEITKSLHNSALLKRNIHKLSDRMFYFGLLTGLAFMLWGKTLGDLVYGESYSIDQKIWISIGVLVFLRYLSGSVGTVLISLGNQAKRVASQVLSTIILLIIAPILIKQYAIAGMLLSLQISVFATFMFYMIIAKRNHITTGFDVYKFIITVAVIFVGVNLEF